MGLCLYSILIQKNNENNDNQTKFEISKIL